MQDDIPNKLKLHPERLEAFLAKLNLGMPQKIQLLSKPGSHVNYVLSFGESQEYPNVIIRREWDTGGRLTFYHEWAALNAMTEQAKFPVVQRYQLYDASEMGWVCAVMEQLPGINGQALMGASPEHGRGVVRAVGQAMAHLREVQYGRYGTRADAGSFLPIRSTWAAEWYANCVQWAEKARNGGIAVDPWVGSLLSRIEANLECLNDVKDWGLVHGSLSPQDLLVSAEDGVLKLTGIVDWEEAIAGDHLLEWTKPLELPGDIFNEVVKGYGSDNAQGLLEGSAFKRLDCYFSGRCLAHLARFTNQRFPMGGGERAQGVEWVRRFASQQEPHWIEQRFEAAMEAADSKGPIAVPPPSPRKVLLRRAFQRLALLPAVGTKWANGWGAVVAMTLLETDYGDNLMGQGHNLAKHFSNHLTLESGEPILDREEWKKNQTTRLTQWLTTHPEGGFALIMWALGIRALEELEHQTTDHSLRGLESLVEQLTAHEQNRLSGGTLSSREQLVRSIVTLAALRLLSSSGLASDVQALEGKLMGIMGDAWYGVEPMVPSNSTDTFPQRLHRLLAINWLKLPEGPFSVVLLWALQYLGPGDHLPVSPVSLLDALGYGKED